MIGSIDTEKDIVSSYQPSKEVQDLTSKVRDDYGTGFEIQQRPFPEFNSRSLIQVINDNQKKFNSHRELESSDPNRSWRWKGTRPITRNKIISMAAHVLSTTIIPNIFAQNDQDERDEMMGNTMRDIIKWNIENSNYSESMLLGVIIALSNPVLWMKVEFTEAMQTVKEKHDNGEITKREVIDEVLSGLQTYVIPTEEILIANAYEKDEQKQRFLIHKREIDYSEAQALYGDHENFKYIKPGIKTLYNSGDGNFYDQGEDENPTLVEEAIYYNRREDIEVPFVNGVYMGDNNPEENRMTHRRTIKDKEGNPVDVPIYPFAKTYYEPINESFFYGKSAAEKLAPEQELVDDMYRMVMNGTFLSLEPPIFTSGADMDEQVIIPGMSVDMPPEAKYQPFKLGSDLNAGYAAIQKIEDSISESTQDEIRQGLSPSGSRTAYEIGQVQQNARIQLGLFGKMIGRLVERVGYLMIDLIIHNQTVGEVEEILGGEVRIKYRNFLLPDEERDGKKITKKIEFDESLMGNPMTDEEVEKEENRLANEIGEDMDLVKVNPRLFAKMRYLVKVDADTMLSRNESFEKAIKLQTYDRMISNPFVNQEQVTRDFLVKPLAKGEVDKYMREQPAGLPVPGGTEPGKSTPLVEQATKSEALKGILQ